MPLLGIDLGGTKLAWALISGQGIILKEGNTLLEGRKGKEVGRLISGVLKKLLAESNAASNAITAIGISVPGISNRKTGTVWAPNIPGWEDYPLQEEIENVCGNLRVIIDNDRACYVMGETWKGAAQECRNAIFLAVGTGIGAGIICDGRILRGAHDIAGAIGWMALEKPFQDIYIECGCFESHASGEGMVRLGKELLLKEKNYSGLLKNKASGELTTHEIFHAYAEGDAVAKEVIRQCIALWGMAIANLVSLFNPEKIILGGGVFGPAVQFIPMIRMEAAKWAQPVSMKQVTIEPSLLGVHAALLGAAWLALQTNQKNQSSHE